MNPQYLSSTIIPSTNVAASIGLQPNSVTHVQKMAHSPEKMCTKNVFVQKGNYLSKDLRRGKKLAQFWVVVRKKRDFVGKIPKLGGGGV